MAAGGQKNAKTRASNKNQMGKGGCTLWNGDGQGRFLGTNSTNTGWKEREHVNECGLGQRSGGEVVDFVTVSAS